MIALAAGFALLAAAAAAMLAVPFVPLWNEWRRPTDDAPLAVDAGDVNDIDHFARELKRSTAERVRLRRWSGAPESWPRSEDAVVARGPLSLEAPLRCGQPVHVTGNFGAPSGSSFAALLVDGDLDLGADSEITDWGRARGCARIAAGSIALRRFSAGESIELAHECSFERLSAPRIVFGADAPADSIEEPEAEAFDPATLPGASMPAAGVVRIDRDTRLPPARRLDASLIVAGSLTIGEGAIVRGSVKAHEGIVVGERARIEGSVVSPRSIHLLAGCRVGGPVVSETDVVIATGVVVGSPARPTTVTAENIIVSEGALAHGTVWAHDVGVVWRG